LVVVVAGLSALGKPLTKKYVHRIEHFKKLAQLADKRADESAYDEMITPRMVVGVLAHPEGGLKNIPETARRVALLNQADTPELQSIGGKMAQELLAEFDAVLVGTLEGSRIQTFEKTAGIILAAGESKRFGQPKQILEYRGQPFVRNVAQAALTAGLSPVIVVTGAHAAQVEAALQDLPVKIAHNPNWQSGQSSSIRVGLQSLSLPYPTPPLLSPVRGEKGRAAGGRVRKREVGSAIFLLADQPQVTPTVMRALVEQHTLNLDPVIAPLVAGRRANPVLFDRVTFPELMALSGDVGGRALLSKYSPTYLPWHDESLLVDVDIPDDLERLNR